MRSQRRRMLVFDEIITGFRYANGGAQELFGVIPDLTTLGKGMANGFPLSAVCGRRDLMLQMEEIFFSFTMGGDTLSLAAAKAAMLKLLREPVIETMRSRGGALAAGVAGLIDKHRVQTSSQSPATRLGVSSFSTMPKTPLLGRSRRCGCRSAWRGGIFVLAPTI